MSENQVTKQLVRAILENANQFEWSLQGLGMLRLYLSKEIRLHIWDSRYAVPNVSAIHSHPWSFSSEVVVGSIINIRFRKVMPLNDGSAPDYAKPYMTAVLQCGPGGCIEGKPERVMLQQMPPRVYKAGECYEQKDFEIHQSIPRDGTVTIVSRVFNDDPDHASVFWSSGSDWVSAEARLASKTEVAQITGSCLVRYFTE